MIVYPGPCILLLYTEYYIENVEYILYSTIYMND